MQPVWDLGEFDQKGNKRTGWGSKEELIEAIKVAKENGIISYVYVGFQLVLCVEEAD